MSRPLFSVVIPTYNRAHTVGSAIHSCLAQTVKDFEIVVVDDEKSTDDIGRALACFTNADIRLISRFKGTAAARNGGVRAARGKYVAFLDSDDEFLPNKLERCLTQLEGNECRGVQPDLCRSRRLPDVGETGAGIARGEDIFDYLLLHKQWVHEHRSAMETRESIRSAKISCSGMILSSLLISVGTA